MHDTAVAVLLLQSSPSLVSSPIRENDSGYEVSSKGSGLEGSSQEWEIQHDGETRMSPTSCPACKMGDRAVQGASLCLQPMVLGAEKQCPEDPHSKWKGDEKDRLPHYYLCGVLHCNLQTSKASHANWNHFSSLNFHFQCLKEAGLGLAAASWLLE